MFLPFVVKGLPIVGDILFVLQATVSYADPVSDRNLLRMPLYFVITAGDMMLQLAPVCYLKVDL